MAELSFEPPGPGVWNLNDLHYPRPLTRYKRDLPSSINSERSQRALAKYGLVIDIEADTVNGFHYISRQPVEGVHDRDQEPITLDGLPADPENEFQRRVWNAKETFETKRWRADLERWDDEWKPAIRKTNRSLQQVSPQNLDDEKLIQYLEDCRGAAIEHGAIMFRILPCAFVPQGDFLAFVREHTDRNPKEVVALFAGATPDSRGAIEERRELVSALEANPDACELVLSDVSPGEILDQLQDFQDGVGAAAENWLAIVGYRIVSGFDLADQYALERPATLVNTLRSALNGEDNTATLTEEPDNLDTIRQSVPPDLRDEFDERYREMRSTHRVQDERALHSMTTDGLLRRALLEVGRRLTERGQLRNPEHVVDMTHDEVVSALRGEPAPPAAEVAAHVHYRERHHASDAPDQLGTAESANLNPEFLPEPAARVLKAFTVRQWANQMEVSGEGGDDVITGHGASPGTVEGQGRIVEGPEDFDRLQDGDILVAEITSPAFNVVLPIVGGIVTDTGGMLSHPAIIAREFGIPGVVGCDDATDRITDGERIIVDGEEGTVRFTQ